MANKRRRTTDLTHLWVLLFSSLALTLVAQQTHKLGYNYETTTFPPPGVPVRSPSDYLLVKRLGAGKFSDVFEAVDTQRSKSLGVTEDSTVDPRSLVVLKCLKPVPLKKIKRELLVLQHASHLPNLARLLAVVVPPDFLVFSNSRKVTNTTNSIDKNGFGIQPMPTLVLEHAHGEWLCHPIKIVREGDRSNEEEEVAGDDAGYLTDEEVRFYLYHLLVALDQLHASGIMHRDVKPRNVLIDRNTKSLMLIDLGLADFYKKDSKYNVRVASRHYKSPELLLGHQGYDYSIDMWGFGCILAGLIFRKEPFFRGRDNVDQLVTIISVLGTADLHRFIATNAIPMSADTRKAVAAYKLKGGNGKAKVWSSLIPKDVAQIAPPSPEGIDLLSKLLRYDHNQRLTAKQAMQHPFFDPVRMQVEYQLHERAQQNMKSQI